MDNKIASIDAQKKQSVTKWLEHICNFEWEDELFKTQLTDNPKKGYEKSYKDLLNACHLALTLTKDLGYAMLSRKLEDIIEDVKMATSTKTIQAFGEMLELDITIRESNLHKIINIGESHEILMGLEISSFSYAYMQKEWDRMWYNQKDATIVHRAIAAIPASVDQVAIRPTRGAQTHIDAGLVDEVISGLIKLEDKLPIAHAVGQITIKIDRLRDDHKIGDFHTKSQILYK